MIDSLLDAIWPRRCAVCGRPADRPGRHVCSECLMRIPFIPAKGCCAVCGRDVEGQSEEFLCEDCIGPNAPRFDRAASAVRFEGVAREMLLGYKFNSRLYLRADFADWIEGAVRARLDTAAIDVVLPMPLTTFHRMDRGYNQSGYLADELGRRFERKVRYDVLKRVGRPSRQAELHEDERRENVKGTIAVVNAQYVRGRTVLVVDDVMTTGSTLSECAKVLKEAGAGRVWCATLARSLHT